MLPLPGMLFALYLGALSQFIYAHAERQDERPPAAPAQGAAVARGADEGRENEAEDGSAASALGGLLVF